jgi:ferredoxin
MTKIYYFSGRGGSLHTARELARLLKADRPAAMTGKHFSGRSIPEQADTVGFVFPVINFGVPVSVRQYLSAYPAENVPRYVFAVALNMGMPCATLTQFEKILHRRGMQLNAGFTIERKAHAAADESLFPPHITEIAAAVESSAAVEWERGSVSDRILLTGLINPVSRLFIGGEDRKFRVSGQCNGCGTCMRVCAAGNIVLKNGRPVWLHSCDQCGACFTWCPREAVSGSCLAARARHPEAGLSAADMMITNGGVK